MQPPADNLLSAEAAYRALLARQPESAAAWAGLGASLGGRGDVDGAIDALTRAAALEPGRSVAHHNLAVVLSKAGRLQEASVAHIRAAQMNPNSAVAWREAGRSLRLIGRHHDAMAALRRAVALDASDAESHGQLALSLLAGGMLEEGWREFEWRWKCASFPDKLRFTDRRWPGLGSADVSGKRLVLQAEQGMGDTIQFVRYGKLLADLGAHVLVQCAAPLKTLMEQCPWVRAVFSPDESAPSFDWQIPMLSLPLAMGTTLSTVPAQVPYLQCSPKRIETWKRKVTDAENRLPGGAIKDPFRIGIVWAGRPQHADDARRSLPLSALAPLARAAGERAVFYSLQKGEAARQAALLPEGMKLIDLAGGLYDFSDTAALMDRLDLVVGVDTAGIHLAGALGKPVWALLAAVADWRWMTGGPDSPWYPTMRLFRQPAPRDWPAVIDQVSRELRQAVDIKASNR